MIEMISEDKENISNGIQIDSVELKNMREGERTIISVYIICGFIL